MIRIIATINNQTTEVGLQPIYCNLSMAINGVWVVKMEHPYDNEGRWQYITEDSVLHIDINCLDGVSSEQQYRITLCQRSLTSIYVEAYPIALDAFNDRVFTSVARNGATPSRLAQDISSSAYPVTTNLPNTLLADYKYENTNLIAIINGGEDCFVEKYGGEIKYNNNAISINNRLDSGNTAYIYAGRDVTSLMHSINTSDVVTRIYPLSANGMRLNARSDAQVPPATPYVDSQYIDDYGVVHSEFIKTHFMLCTEDAKNADVSAFDRTMQFRNEIFEEVQNWMQDLAYSYEYIDDTKRNIEYLQSILKLTKEKNKNSGIIEGLQKAITAELTNVAFKQMVNNWIKDACEEFDNIDAPEYKLVKVGTNQYIYADIDTNDRAIGEWHHLDSKWRWFTAPNGYLDDSRDNNKNWSWYADTGAVVTEGQPFPKLYGSKSDNIFLRDQWEKVNGTWYWFDQQGHHLKPSTQIKNMVRWIVTRYGASSFASEVANMEKQLYEEMYQRMVEHSEWLFSEGVDRPKMEINLEAMDISQIEGYQQLQTLSLGNNVVFRNNGTTINERVVELDYDCIRKVNTRIVLGMPTETISAIISRNIETNPALIAGYGVDIDGNVINIAQGGGEVKGLRWWEETFNHIERTTTSVPSGGWICDDEYLVNTQAEWQDLYDEGSLEYTKFFRKKTAGKAIGALMHFYSGGSSTKVYAPILLSTVKEDVSIMFGGRDEPPSTEMYGYINTITYEGIEWYVSGGNTFNTATLDPSACLYEPANDIKWRDNSYNTYSGSLPVISTLYEDFYEAIMALLQIANIRTRASYITGIDVGGNYPFYGGYVGDSSPTPENAPFKVDKEGNIYGEDAIAGDHVLSNKQDRLTAGSNIQISNNTISATDTTYSDFAGSTHGLVPPVTTQAGKYLKDDGTWATVTGASSVDTLTDVELTNLSDGQILKYNSSIQEWVNANESGGTTVIANPSGTATANLLSLQVGNDIYSVDGGSGGLVEVTTDILTGESLNWDMETTGGMLSYIYTTNKTYLSFGISPSYTDADRCMDVYTIPIPTTAKKIRYRFTENGYASQDPSQDMYKLCIGVKTTLDTQNYTTPTDSDFLTKKLYQFASSSTVIEGEIYFSSASPVYLYIVANGFACTFDLLEVVEYIANLDDLDDVNIITPTNGQVLTYNSNNQSWENANAGGGGYTDVTGTLIAGNTSITLSDVAIDTNATLDFYTSVFGVNPTAISVATGSVTLTFPAQASDIGVKVRVS